MSTYSRQQEAVGSLETLAELRTTLNSVMALESHTSLDNGGYEFRGRLTVDSGEAFDHIYDRFTALGYTPVLFRHDGQEIVVAQRGVVKPKAANPRTNIILLILTIISTLFVGAVLYAPSPDVQQELLLDPLSIFTRNAPLLLNGLPYALTLLGILGIHEMGHYVFARKHKAAVTLPYFIPMPLGLGTMGAVILLRSPIKNRRQLFDIGVAGPLAGLAVAIPLLLVGLATSPVEFVSRPLPGSQEGNSILYLLLKYLVHGQILPSNGYDVILNAIAFPAWFGLFITSLNLLPIGSLDGGHVTYAMYGRRQWRIARAAWMLMLIAGGAMLLLRTELGLNVWLLWAILVQLFGVMHPPPLDDITPLDLRRRALGIFTLFLLFILIVPIPFS
ncbi:MAG TPA: site-2 protease family protein [Anaerolineae bacterium]|nr:site-2 protease family protein [Anaerolineae bacterium]